MKITGTSSCMEIDMENGYRLKVEGEILIGGRFVAYKDTIKAWEPPYENEILTEETINEIIGKVNAMMDKNTVQIIFE